MGGDANVEAFLALNPYDLATCLVEHNPQVTAQRALHDKENNVFSFHDVYARPGRQEGRRRGRYDASEARYGHSVPARAQPDMTSAWKQHIVDQGRQLHLDLGVSLYRACETARQAGEARIFSCRHALDTALVVVDPTRGACPVLPLEVTIPPGPQLQSLQGISMRTRQGKQKDGGKKQGKQGKKDRATQGAATATPSGKIQGAKWKEWDMFRWGSPCVVYADYPGPIMASDASDHTTHKTKRSPQRKKTLNDVKPLCIGQVVFKTMTPKRGAGLDDAPVVGLRLCNKAIIPMLAQRLHAKYTREAPEVGKMKKRGDISENENKMYIIPLDEEVPWQHMDVLHSLQQRLTDDTPCPLLMQMGTRHDIGSPTKSKASSDASYSCDVTTLQTRQCEALDKCCKDDIPITLVQGPPGTGKSHTAAAIVKALLATGGTGGVAVSFTNRATDDCVRNAIKSGIKRDRCVRMGRRTGLDQGKMTDLPYMLHDRSHKQADTCGTVDFLESTLVSLPAFSERLTGSLFPQASRFFGPRDCISHGTIRQLYLWLRGDVHADVCDSCKANPEAGLCTPGSAWELTSSERLDLWLQVLVAFIEENVLKAWIHASSLCSKRTYAENRAKGQHLRGGYTGGSRGGAPVAQVDPMQLLAMTSTYGSMCAGMLAGFEPSFMLLEEAAQIPEAYVLALLVPSIRQIVMIGDHMQLPPSCEPEVTWQATAVREGLGDSKDSKQEDVGRDVADHGSAMRVEGSPEGDDDIDDLCAALDDVKLDARSVEKESIQRHESAFAMNISLMERLWKQKTESEWVSTVTLDKQFRMRDELCEYARIIYPELTSHDTTQSLREAATDSACIVVNHPWHDDGAKPAHVRLAGDGAAQTAATWSSTSRTNAYELKVVVDCVSSLLAMGVSGHQIAILAPYQGQVTALTRRLQQDTRIRTPVRTMATGSNGSTAEGSGRQLSTTALVVATVDSFQGSEREYIVASLVASRDAQSRTGTFLSDPCRMNVLLTRAQRHMHIVGNLDYLSRQPGSKWQSVVDIAKESGCYHTVTLSDAREVVKGKTRARTKRQVK